MLITCPECDLCLSDKALACPHCGFPMTGEVKPKQVAKKPRKRRRLPNGFGQISEVKNRNLRRPFRVSVTVGFSENGKPICKPLKPKSYFETYNEAYQALIEYNKDPYDLDKFITMDELFEEWLKIRCKGDSDTITTYRARWRYISSIHSIPAKTIRVRHLVSALEEGYIMKGDTKNPIPRTVKPAIKSMLNLLFDYAVQNEITDRNYARLFAIDQKDGSTEVEKEHIPYTDQEIELLWEHKDAYPIATITLIQIYSGWRPQELMNLKLTDVDLANKTFTGGLKTRSGRNRVVPIHSRIYDMVVDWYRKSTEVHCKYLFSTPETKTSSRYTYYVYNRYVRQFEKMREELNIDPRHRPHDGRVQFVTMAKRAGVDEYVIKRIVGHYIDDVTEKSYTKRDVEWLRTELEKIE